jgi:hypothetical protein
MGHLRAWYGPVIDFLTKGSSGLSQLGRSERRRIKRLALKYRIASRELVYLERNGQWAVCIEEEKTQRVLRWAHDLYGHYLSILALDRLVGQFYWPTRTFDCNKWYKSCDVYQRMGPRKKSCKMSPIIKFALWEMVGMDFLGPITPEAEDGSKYILVVVYYFSRMVFVRATPSATKEDIILFWNDVLIPIFGFPGCIYIDNGSHFDNFEVRSFFESHGSEVIYAPITHP